MKPRVYLETTIPNYLTAWPTRDLVRTAHQQVTREWWDERREGFELVFSQAVIRERVAGDPVAAAESLNVINGLDFLEGTTGVVALTRDLIRGLSLPKRAEADAFHIAISAVHRVDFLLTWNCTHIANAALRGRLEPICDANGFADL